MDLSLKLKLDEYIKSTKSDWNYITPIDFYHKYHINKKEAGKYLLIDLREKTVYDKYHIKGSINIFWLDLLKEENLKKIPKDKIIFLICYVGHTSSQALVLLKLLGYKAVGIKFGYGISPVFEVPVAGWLDFNYETTLTKNHSHTMKKSKSKRTSKSKKKLKKY
jgi:rhodanese-related sulfurtransferase